MYLIKTALTDFPHKLMHDAWVCSMSLKDGTPIGARRIFKPERARVFALNMTRQWRHERPSTPKNNTHLIPVGWASDATKHVLLFRITVLNHERALHSGTLKLAIVLIDWLSTFPRLYYILGNAAVVSVIMCPPLGRP